MENYGHSKAIASLVLGIISCICIFTGIGAVIGIITGIIGIVQAKKAAEEGNEEGIRTAGFVCSIVGTVLSGISIALTILGLIFATSIIGSFLNYL